MAIRPKTLPQVAHELAELVTIIDAGLAHFRTKVRTQEDADVMRDLDLAEKRLRDVERVVRALGP